MLKNMLLYSLVLSIGKNICANIQMAAGNIIQRQYKQVNAHHDNKICNMELMPKFHKISIDSIQQHCLIVSYEENSQFIMQVNEPALWADSFSNV